MSEQKNSIMKMLLSAPHKGSNIRETLKTGKMSNSTSADSDENMSSKLSSKLQQLFGQNEGSVSTVDLDHNYSRPWNWRPENSYTKPVKTLFMQRLTNAVSGSIDINGIDEASRSPVYDAKKARQLMEECEKHISLIRSQAGDSDWEENIDKSDWTPNQVRLLDRVIRLLNFDKLARLAAVSSWNEPVLRRISVNKTASRFRATLASIGWETKLTQWLHNLLMENLDSTSLAAYIDILQTLKSKVPTLVERMMTPTGGKSGTSMEMLNLLLQRPWDPSAFGMNSYNPKKLPGNPILLIVPSSPYPISQNSRPSKWQTYLSQLGTVTHVATPTNSSIGKVNLMSSLEQMMAATRAKISEIKSDYMGKNIILIGLNTGAALACQVALVEHLTSVVCLGFPLNTVEDKRGQPDDAILNMSVPVLFVIGQHAATASVDDIEDLRERLHVETGLVIVGAADDQLRITKSKQAAEGITQSMVDRCIVDEVGDFLGTILSNPHGPSGREESGRVRYRMVERKRRLNDDPYTPQRRQRASNFAGKVRRTRGTGQRGGRSRWTAQVHRTQDGPGLTSQIGGINSYIKAKREQLRLESLASITRASGLMEKSQPVRPSIDNISVINAIQSEGESSTTVDTSSIKILPQIKVLGSEECIPRGNGMGIPSDLVDQLTPDSLLEMPVIIAQEDPQESTLPVKVVVSSTKIGKSGGIKCVTKVNSGGGIGGVTKIFLRKKESEIGTIYLKENEHQSESIKPRIRHFPATKHSDSDLF